MALCAILVAAGCTQQTELDVQQTELDAQQAELDAAATSEIVADLSTLSSGVFSIEERVTIDGQEIVIRDRVAFQLGDGNEVTHQQSDYSDLTDATISRAAELVTLECQAAELDPEPSDRCSWEFLWAYGLSAMGTPSELWVVGNPSVRSDPPAAILMNARDFSRIESAWANRLPMFLQDDSSAESYFGGPAPEPIETDEASRVWGNLQPYADQAPQALSAMNVQLMISDFISALESGEAEHVRGDGDTWTIGLGDGVSGLSTGTIAFLQLYGIEPEIQDRSLQWTIETSVDPDEIGVPDQYLERSDFLNWMREK